MRNCPPAASGYAVHRHARARRSTAAGLTLLYLESGSEERVATELLRVKPLLLPDRRLIRLFDHELGSRLASIAENLWPQARDYLKGRIRNDPDDYLDELESSD